MKRTLEQQLAGQEVTRKQSRRALILSLLEEDQAAYRAQAQAMSQSYDRMRAYEMLLTADSGKLWATLVTPQRYYIPGLTGLNPRQCEANADDGALPTHSAPSRSMGGKHQAALTALYADLTALGITSHAN
jgi:hypothetical protein